MTTNFKIISFTKIELNGIEFDLHNDFEFLAEKTEILESSIKLYFNKSSEPWVNNVKAEKLIFILENYNFLKQIEPKEEYIEDDFCLSGITFFDNDFRDEDYGLMDRVHPKENDDIIFSFESERVIRVNCETVICRIE